MRWILAVLAIFVFGINSPAGSGPYNYAAQWQSYSHETRAAYVEGMADGIVSGVRDTTVFFEKSEISDETLKKLDRLFIDDAMKDQLPRVVTHLYSDPANAFIQINWMVSIAREKLQGEDVSETLRKHREIAIKLDRYYKLKRN